MSGAAAVKNANVAEAIGLLLMSVMFGVRYALYQLVNANWPELVCNCAI